MMSVSGDPPGSRSLSGPEHVSFMRVRLREGYAVGQVDAFVEQAVLALSARDPSVRAEDVRAVRFAPVRVRAGYDMREVDAFLDELEKQLPARQPDPSSAQGSRGTVPRSRTVPAWAGHLKGALLLVVVVLWVYAEVLTKH
jgi:DivIVA domain-containing protein